MMATLVHCFGPTSSGKTFTVSKLIEECQVRRVLLQGLVLILQFTMFSLSNRIWHTYRQLVLKKSLELPAERSFSAYSIAIN